MSRGHTPAGLTDAQRFELHVDRRTGRGPHGRCHTWNAATNPSGYGVFFWDGRVNHAHIFAWIQKHGPVPPGMEVCHSCDNPPCVNDECLFVGTHADNMLDALNKGRLRVPKVKVFGVQNANGKKTHCPADHEYTAENTGFNLRANGNTNRFCRICRRASTQKSRAA